MRWAISCNLVNWHLSCPIGNAAALALIDSWPDWPNRVVMLVGDAGSGKSHLASIWAARSGARSTSAHVLSAATVPAALVTGALVVEDLSAPGLDERALFHLLNLAREDGADVLMTARTNPAGWHVELRDLVSRLRALPVVALAAPDDQLLRALIVKFAADRQMKIDESIVGYLATRIERSSKSAREAVDRLDREALQQGRAVTRALAVELFRDPAG
jgi:chromosomal replication initiation ATPase DnaA